MLRNLVFINIGILLVCGTGMLINWHINRTRRRNKAEQRRLKLGQMIEAAEKGDLKLIRLLIYNKSTYEDVVEFDPELKRKFKRAYAIGCQTLLFHQLDTSLTDFDRLASYVAILRNPDMESAKALGRSVDAVIADFTELLATCRSELADVESMSQIRFDMWRGYLSQDHHFKEVSRIAAMYDLAPLVAGASWNDRVARTVDNPVVSDFEGIDLPGDLRTGQARLMAGRAIVNQEVTLACMVLALCNYSVDSPYKDNRHFKWREEVGDALLADLTKLVKSAQNAKS